MARRAAFVAVSDAWSRRMGFTAGRASRSLPQKLLALRVTMGGRSNKSLDASGGSVFRNLIRPAMLD